MELVRTKAKPSTRRVMLGGGAGLAGVLLAACGASTSTSTGTTSGGSQPAAPAPSLQPVTIRSWIGEPQNERFPATQAADTAIKAKYPHLTVEHEVQPSGDQITKTVAAAAANSLPDVTISQGTNISNFASKGLFVPLDTHIAKMPAFEMADFPKVAIDLYKVGGKQYAIPYDHAPIMLFYNKDLFDRFGVKVPDSTWTMDTLLEAARKLHRPDEGIWGMAGFAPGGGFTAHGTFYMPWGKGQHNDDETETYIDSPEVLQALDFWVKTRMTYKVNPMPADGNARQLFVGGKAALHEAGLWGWRDIAVARDRATVPFTPDVADWPSGPKGRFTSSMGSGYGITKDSKTPDAAWLYLSEYVGKDLERSIMGQFLKTGYGIPVRNSLMARWETSKEHAPPSAKLVNPAMAKYSVMGRPISPVKGDIDKVVNDGFATIWSGQATVADAAREMKRLMQPLLDQNKKR